MTHCTYCGDFASGRDRVVPCASQGVRAFSYGEIVVACTECNSTLQALILPTVPARAAYLLGRLQQKYKRALRSPKWDADELEDLGPTLRSAITSQQAEQERVRARLEHLSGVARG